jgi:signal transduction histidine kinase
MIFYLQKFKQTKYQSSTTNSGAERQYVQIKLTKMKFKENWQSIVQIIDISSSIMYNQEHASSSFLALINATISHELSNPLNSIMS